MTIEPDARERVDKYLAKLRRNLAGVSGEEAADIVKELRSHILEKAGAGGEITPAAIEAALAGLGTPEELAAQYLANELLTSAARKRSPVLFLRGLLRWARLSFAGAWVLLGCVAGYLLGASLIVCAILKPLHPHTAGLWALPGETQGYSLRMGFQNVPAGGRELLGWWMVPVGLLLGGGMCFLTTQGALWCARLYRRSHALHRANRINRMTERRHG